MVEGETSSTCDMCGERDVVGKSERIRRLGKPKHRWEDNIKIKLK